MTRERKTSRDPRPDTAVGLRLVSCALAAVAAFAAAVVAFGILQAPVRASNSLRLMAEAGTLRLVPASAQVDPGDTVQVEVWLENVAEYYTLDVRVGFDPELVEVPDGGVDPLWDLFDKNNHWIIRKQVDHDAGEVWYAVTNLNPAQAFEGTGRVCAITFQGLTSGTTSLDINYAQGSTRFGESLYPEQVGGQLTVGSGLNPPIVTQITPPTATVGDPGLELRVKGNHFITDSVVVWNGSPRATALLSSTALTASIGPSDLGQAGVIHVSVRNSEAAGDQSSFVPFTVTNPSPTVAQLDPLSITVGAPGMTVRIIGSGFTEDSVVVWEGEPLSTTLVNGTHLTTDVPQPVLAAAGTFTVAVINPKPGGGTSNVKAFTVANPVPSVSHLDPLSATSGAPGLTLTIVGNGFVEGSTVLWDGEVRSATLVSSTSLTAAIPPADLIEPGAALVSVSTPGPGGGVSNLVSFEVKDRSPAPDTNSVFLPFISTDER
jgi:hypothetical protein